MKTSLKQEPLATPKVPSQVLGAMSGENTRVLQWHKYFMEIALLTSGLSYAEKMKVGAVAVRDKRVLCTGYNGTPPGSSNSCEHFSTELNKLVTLPEVEHAERNLMYYAAKNGIRLDGAELYITHTPCVQCARGILLSGFSRVYYRNLHKSDGMDFLAQHNIETTYV